MSMNETKKGLIFCASKEEGGREVVELPLKTVFWKK
jgi:hypothetical protein